MHIHVLDGRATLTMNQSQFRRRMTRLMRKISAGLTVIVTRFGQPRVVCISSDEYERLKKLSAGEPYERQVNVNAYAHHEHDPVSCVWL